MKTKKGIFLVITCLTSILAMQLDIQLTQTSVQVTDFEIVLPWGMDHERGKIIRSMIENHSTLGSKYNFIYSVVGGGPSDRDALIARFLVGDYPNLIITTLDWYTKFAEFGIWHSFTNDIAMWSGVRAGWQSDIPAGWWNILDRGNRDGSGPGIFALPFFGQTILPYINVRHFTDAELVGADIDTLEGFISSAKTLKTDGNTPFAQVGRLQSDIAYMNYMFASTDNFINSSNNPATVFNWDINDRYGTNGSLSVEGLATYLKLKGEGLVPETVDSDGGGETIDNFANEGASMVLCGPWASSIFMGQGLPADDFKAVPMTKSSDGIRSTIIGGGISWVPAVTANATEITDAAELAQWLLDDENQMKTVSNWLDTSWRFPARESLKFDPWFTEVGHPERANFVTHIESQEYAYSWGRQHPQWLNVHENIMMPGYRDALLEIEWGKGYTDQTYLEKAQYALDGMAAEIQCYYLGGPCVRRPNSPPVAEILFPTGGETFHSSDLTINVIWEMTDAEDNNSLRAYLFYSTDQIIWNSIVEYFQYTSYLWNISGLEASSTYNLKLIVGDNRGAIGEDITPVFTITTAEKTTQPILTSFSTASISLAFVAIFLLKKKRMKKV